LANQALHQNIIESARVFYVGGPNNGTFAFSYATAAMAADALSFLQPIQEARVAASGSQYTVVELAEVALAELEEIDASCRRAACYV
jgi:hypothetical protein